MISYCIWMPALCQNTVTPVKPYVIKPAAIITATSLVFNAALYTYGQSALPPTVEQLNGLSTHGIPLFERFGVSKYSVTMAHISDVGVACILVTPAFLMLNKKIDHIPFALHYIESISLAAFVTQSCKTAFPRYRPFAYNTSLSLSDRQTTDGRQSFFSLHTSLTSAATFYAASFLNHKVQAKGVRVVLWTAAIVLPAVVGYTRVAAGQHFITDVCTGYIVGAACGMGTYYFSK